VLPGDQGSVSDPIAHDVKWLAMCGRYLMHAPPELLAELFDLQEIPIVTQRFNVAPTQQVLACRQTDKGRELVALHWGLILFWADDPKIG